MRKLILVKHSHTQPTPDLPNSQWPLSDLGRQRCQALAAKLAPYNPATIVSSEYPRAMQTAQIVADALGKPVHLMKGLHEHERETVPIMDTRELLASVALLFQKPGTLVLGEETAHQARDRFARAIDTVLGEYPEGDVVVVAHGTVISLFVAQHSNHQPYQLWRRMGLPSYVVLSVPGYEVAEIVERIE